LVNKEHDAIMKKLKKNLPKNCPTIQSTSVLFKQFSQRLRAWLTLRYMTPLSFLDQIRAEREFNTAKSILHQLKEAHLLLRESDKGGNLCVVEASDLEQKAAEYRAKTGAYKELPANPVEDILLKVTRLLNDLHMKTKQLEKQHYKKMMPIRSKVKLAHMYYNPKTHKVIIELSFISDFMDIFLCVWMSLGTNIRSTNYEYHSFSNHWHISIFGSIDSISIR
jgi:hypothetical protein